ncbi:hypothetical protein [Desulfuromonas soudanensis]|uniref:hypothetical protein n=1 Tax=Desulfuromonas soudanensis TaxID=1603606 RepID=UPI0006AD2D35|nr:hypothetical protein [Desulfuromonas soudanensis]
MHVKAHLAGDAIGNHELNFKFIVLSIALLAITCVFWSSNVEAAELIIRVDTPPKNGAVIAMLFNSSSTFVDLRDPFKIITLSSGGATPGRITGLAAGEYALAGR